MAVTDDRRPSLIASHVDVTYRVYGAKRVVSTEEARPSWVARLLGRRGDAVAAVREVPAVKDVSFIAHHGESIAIVGRNGSGKSTLLRALAGLVPPSGGEIYTAGRPALLGVNAVLMRELSGERNVMIGGLAMGLTRGEVREKMDDIVSFAGVEDFISLPMKAYSSGMAARLRFAISTAAVPDILMIDEALGTGDAAFRAKSKERVDEIRERAGTVFLVSHNDVTIRSMCDRALWLDKGSLIMDGPVDDVLDAYQESRQEDARKQKLAKERRAAARKRREQEQQTGESGREQNAPGPGREEPGETAAPATDR